MGHAEEMTMVEAMDELTDEMLKSIQRRVYGLEAEVADIRSALAHLRHDMEAARGGQPVRGRSLRG